MKKEKKTDPIKFPRWFHPLKEPVLCPTIKAAIKEHESRVGQWKYLVEQWNIVKKEKRRVQYEKLKAEFEGV